jgi:tetratricopeptide (TPR) repeat protein
LGDREALVGGDAAMSRALVTSSRYSPGNLPGDTLQRLFVARGTLLDDALRRIESALKKGSQQFLLFVGPRGAGKTHLLALLRHRIDHDPRFEESRARLCVAPLNEEEWGIASYLDLLVRILQSIASREGGAAFEAEIQGIYRAFGQAQATVIQTAEELLTRRVGKRTLLLLCENLDEILDGLGDEGQKRWRAFIQQRRYWNIVATSPSLSRALQDRAFPFYNFFNVRHLDRLTLDEASELIRRKAEVDGKAGLATLLDSPMGRARMRAIHHLAGGNSRVYVILADFLDQESLDALWPTFQRTIDDLTPYYQDRMRQLAPAQRKIVECLCLAGHPIIVKEIAARCLMTPQTAAKQLSELARLRYVLREQHGRESWYELAEPLMRICIDVKDNRTRHLRTFVELLRRWFSADEMRDRLGTMEGEPAMRRPVDRLHLEAALREHAERGGEPYLDALSEEVRASIERAEYRAAITACERLVKERAWPTDFFWLARVQGACTGLDAELKTLRQGLKKHPGDEFLTLLLLGALLDLDRAQEALDVIGPTAPDRGESLSLASERSEILIALGRNAEACVNDERILVEHRKGDVTQIAKILERLGRPDEALQRLDRALRLKPTDRALLDRRGWILLNLGRSEELLAHETARGMSADHYSAFRMIRALCGLGRHNEALQLVDQQITRSVNDARAHQQRADVLSEMGLPLDALNSVQRALELAPADRFSWLIKAHILISLRRFDGAVEAAMQAVHLGGSPRVCREFVTNLIDKGVPDGVIRILDALEARDGSSDETTLLRARALLDLGRFQDAWASLSARGRAADRPPTWHATLVAAEAAAVSPDAALRQLEKLLNTATLEQRNDVTAWLIAKLLIVTARAHGAMALAGFLPRLRASLSSHDLVPLLAGGVVALLQDLNAHRDRITAEWDLALPRVMEALADVEDTELTLQMLSVLVRHVRSGDPTVLLELPLETRQLLALPDQGAAPREA